MKFDMIDFKMFIWSNYLLINSINNKKGIANGNKYE